MAVENDIDTPLGIFTARKARTSRAGEVTVEPDRATIERSLHLGVIHFCVDQHNA